MPKHFLSLADIDATELRSILDEAHRIKAARKDRPKGQLDPDAPFKGETLALIFEKSSTRTRFSFDMAMRQLGGSSITATSNDMQIGRGETIEDTAKVLSRFVDGIMLRANSHDTITTLAHNSDIPVINGLTDYNHPCQIMADLQTLEERGGDLKDMTLTWVGDGNNVAVSFINAAAERCKLNRNPFHPFSTFDTVSLAGLAYGQTVLSRSVQAAGIDWDNEHAHSAAYDALKTAELFCNITNRWRKTNGLIWSAKSD